MTDPTGKTQALTPVTNGANRPSYKCAECAAVMYSPFHTVCPACACVISSETIETALGAKVELAARPTTAPNNWWLGVVVAVVALLAIVVMFILRKS